MKGQAKKRVALAGRTQAALNGLADAGAQSQPGPAPAAKANGFATHGPSSRNGHANGKSAVHLNGAASTRNGSAATKPANKSTSKLGKQTEKVSQPVRQDQRLVLRCLSGDPAAWSQMYERFHASLLTSIRAFLGRAGQDMHLVDEISARVWYSLVRNEFELLAKFDPQRGCRFSTFLSVLGKSEARLLLRSERRRKTRECVASRREIEQTDVECESVLSDSEFLATLSPRERSFYLDILVATYPNDNDTTYTRHNQWQLRHRVRKKLEQYLE